ncbi:MAG: hypothetical protein IJ833_02540, partial [Lachnospiraceae bacterium]|nr:hypothetical protein [Lachnospiraceae bacterium]
GACSRKDFIGADMNNATAFSEQVCLQAGIVHLVAVFRSNSVIISQQFCFVNNFFQKFIHRISIPSSGGFSL